MAAMDSVRQRLKQASAGLHQQVDEAFSDFSLATPDGYRAFLRAHAAALFALEAALERNAIDTLLEDWPQRRRSVALRHDLEALGDEAPPALGLPQAPLNTGWCWGACYVLEGSRLGGQLLARRLQQAQPGAPMAYLAHAARAGLWQGFLQRLETAAGGCDEGELRRGVEDAFQLFLDAARQQRCAEPVD